MTTREHESAFCYRPKFETWCNLRPLSFTDAPQTGAAATAADHVWRGDNGHGRRRFFSREGGELVEPRIRRTSIR
jgi:hypothetical protein